MLYNWTVNDRCTWSAIYAHPRLVAHVARDREPSRGDDDTHDGREGLRLFAPLKVLARTAIDSFRRCLLASNMPTYRSELVSVYIAPEPETSALRSSDPYFSCSPNRTAVCQTRPTWQSLIYLSHVKENNIGVIRIILT